MTLRELIDNSRVPVTVLDSKTGQRILIECYTLNSKTEKYGDLVVFDIHVDCSRHESCYNVTFRPYMKVYAHHEDIKRIKNTIN